MNHDRLARLEEKLAWLQRHVTEQDMAMLEMAGEIERLKKQLAELREKPTGESDGPPAGGDRPPHY
jgi:SlyX protein